LDHPVPRSQTVGHCSVGCGKSSGSVARDGLTVTLRRSKTDQEGAGRKIGIPYGSYPGTCPVRTVHTCLELAGISEGPVFRSVSRQGQVQPARLSRIYVARAVKKPARRAGLDASKYAAQFPSCRACHRGGHCRCLPTLHHEPGRTPFSRDGSALYPPG